MKCSAETTEYDCIRERGHFGAHWAYVLDDDGLNIVEWESSTSLARQSSSPWRATASGSLVGWFGQSSKTPGRE